MPGLFDSMDFHIAAIMPDDDAADVRRREILAEARRNAISGVEIAERPADMPRFVSFGSGSSGNCAYVGTQNCGVLIDAGVDAAKVETGLTANGIDPRGVAGIIVTHDHGDHVRYAYSLLRHHSHMKLWATPRCLNGILRRHSLSRRIKDYHVPVYKEFQFTIGELAITPFETSHDGTDNVGYCIEIGGHVMVVATDTGVITERADHYIRKAHHLMIEANYDADMLRRCARPEYLKARIASEHGHMDNAETARYLASAWTPQLRNVFLCHLSEDTNTPELALEAVRQALEAAGVRVGDGSGRLGQRDADVQLTALPRFETSTLTFF